MWQRFTERARRVILLGQQAAVEMHSGHVGTEHLLLGLLRENEGIGAQVLQKVGVALPRVQQEISHVSGVSDEYVRPELSLQDIEQMGAHFKVDPELVREIEARILLKLRKQSKAEPKLTTAAKRVLELAAEEARYTQRILKHSNYIGTEHLLLGLLREKDGLATKVLNKLGLDLEQGRAQVIEYLQSHGDLPRDE